MPKIADLPELTTATLDDLLYIVDDPLGSPDGKKITVANLLGTAAPTITAEWAFATAPKMDGGLKLQKEATPPTGEANYGTVYVDTNGDLHSINGAGTDYTVAYRDRAQAFTGTQQFADIDINGGAIDGTVIGAAAASAGTFTNLTATGTVTLGGVLDDLTALGAPTTDGQIIVATGAGAFAYESGATARTSLGLGTGDSVQFTNGTFTGTLASTGNFTVNTDKFAVNGTSGSIDFGASAVLKLGTSSYFKAGTTQGFLVNNSSDTLNLFKVADTGAVTIYQGSLTLSSGSPIIRGSTTTGYLDLFGDPGAAQGVRISDTGTVTIASDLTLASGSITSASGAISFGNENLSTTGTGTFAGMTVNSSVATITAASSAVYDSGAAQGDLGNRLLITSQLNNNDNIAQIVFRQRNVATYDTSIGASGGSSGFVFVKTAGVERARFSGSGLLVASDLTLASGSITSASGAISFGNENLSTTGYSEAGNARSATWVGAGTFALFGHKDFNTTTGYALLQSSAGATTINSATGQVLNFNVGGTNRYSISASGNHNFQSGSVTTTGVGTFNGLVAGSVTGNDRVLAYRSGNTKYGMGVAAATLKLFTADGGTIEFGRVSSTDGTTYTASGFSVATATGNITTTGTLASGTQIVTGKVTVLVTGSSPTIANDVGVSVSRTNFPSIILDSTAAAAGLKLWQIYGSSTGTLAVRRLSDAGVGSADILQITDTGITTTGTLASGAATVTGNLTISGSVLKPDNTSSLQLVGGADGNSPYLLLYGRQHATRARDIELSDGASGNGVILAWDSSALSWSMQGALNVTGTLASGNATVASATPFMRVQDSDSAGTAAVPIFELYDSTSRIGYLGFTSAVTGHMSLVNSVTNGDLNITTTGTGSIILSASGTGAIALQENTTVTGTLETTGLATFSSGATVGSVDATTSQRLQFADSGGIEWHISYLSDGLYFLEQGIGTTRLRLHDGGGMTVGGDTTVTGTLTVNSTAAASVTLNSTSASGHYLTFEKSGTASFLVGAGTTLFTSGGAGVRLAAGEKFSISCGDASEKVTVDSSGNLIVGASVVSTSSNAQFYATKTYSAASGTDYGGFFNYTQSVATTGGLYGQYVQSTASHTSGTVANIIGNVVSARATGAGGTTTNLYGAYIQVINSNASAVVGSAFGLYVQGHTATGTITNRWGIYQAGASENNYLAGSLRIGTTSATSHGEEALRVFGTNRRLLNLHANSNNASTVQFTNNQTNSTAGSGFLVGIDDSENAWLKNYSSTAMIFETAGTERFRVASNAYALGIGTADVEAWDSSWAAIEFGNTAIWAQKADDAIHISSNAYFDGTTRYKNGGVASDIFLDAGEISFRTAASGTINAALTWDTRVKVTNAGNLLLGGTSEATSAAGALHIFNGTAPTGSVANGVVLYAEDVAASSELKVRDEAGNVTTLSPHNRSLLPDATGEFMSWTYYSQRDGFAVNADMMHALRVLEDLSGEKLIYIRDIGNKTGGKFKDRLPVHGRVAILEDKIEDLEKAKESLQKDLLDLQQRIADLTNQIASA